MTTKDVKALSMPYLVKGDTYYLFRGYVAADAAGIATAIDEVLWYDGTEDGEPDEPELSANSIFADTVPEFDAMEDPAIFAYSLVVKSPATAKYLRRRPTATIEEGADHKVYWGPLSMEEMITANKTQFNASSTDPMPMLRDTDGNAALYGYPSIGALAAVLTPTGDYTGVYILDTTGALLRLQAGVLNYSGDAEIEGNAYVGSQEVGTTLTRVEKHLSAREELAFSAINVQETADVTMTVHGAVVGDTVTVTPDGDPGSRFVWSGWVSAADTVTVRVANVSSGSSTPSTLYWRASVWHYADMGALDFSDEDMSGLIALL